MFSNFYDYLSGATAAIQAHRSPVVALAIYDKESDRTLDEIPDNHTSAIYQVPDTRAILATASSTGTVVRLWVMKTLGTVEQIAELRRGVRRHALVESMNFSADGKWLALTSDTETIHIWRLDKLQSDNKSKSFDSSSPETSSTQQVNATSVQNLTNTVRLKNLK